MTIKKVCLCFFVLCCLWIFRFLLFLFFCFCHTHIQDLWFHTFVEHRFFCFRVPCSNNSRFLVLNHEQGIFLIIAHLLALVHEIRFVTFFVTVVITDFVFIQLISFNLLLLGFRGCWLFSGLGSATGFVFLPLHLLLQPQHFVFLVHHQKQLVLVLVLSQKRCFPLRGFHPLQPRWLLRSSRATATLLWRFLSRGGFLLFRTTTLFLQPSHHSQFPHPQSWSRHHSTPMATSSHHGVPLTYLLRSSFREW